MDYQGKSRMEVRPNLSPMNIRSKHINIDNPSPSSLGERMKHTPGEELASEAFSMDYPLEPPSDPIPQEVLAVEEEEDSSETTKKIDRPTSQTQLKGKMPKRKKSPQKKA